MSLNRICVQCGQRFVLSDSEINFYNSKKLSLPKRCKTCREVNKGNIPVYQCYTKRRTVDKNIIAFVFTASWIIALMLLLNLKINYLAAFIASLISACAAALLVYHLLGAKVEIQEFDTSPYTYTFYNTDSMVSHYVKHGGEVSCISMEDYLLKANMAITNLGALRKTQKKDGDSAYFIPSTGEFVVVAKAGYIRTYFKASMNYFNRQ